MGWLVGCGLEVLDRRCGEIRKKIIYLKALLFFRVANFSI